MLHRQKLQSDLLRIRKRLGGAMQQSVSAMMDEAFDVEAVDGSLDGHRQWIRVLLEDYYDPMYDYQLSRRSGERLFSGDRDAVVAWAGSRAT
jgi:tRNA 2-selenouridine synthase